MEYKHHSSSKSAGARKGAGSFGTVVIVIVSIVLIAGIIVLSPLGEYLMEHIINPLLSCNSGTIDHSIVSALTQQEKTQPSASPSALPTEKQHEVITVEETTFYILQMGAFTDAQAAEQHAEEIMRLGAGGTVFQEGSIYRVFAAAYADETSLKKVQAQVRADGFEATPYITESKGFRVSLDGDQQAVGIVKDAIELLNGIPSELCTLCIAFDKGDISESKLYDELESKRAECAKSADEIKLFSTKDVESIQDILQKYGQNISTFLSEHDTMNAEMVSGALKHLQLSVIIDYILFFDQK